nr:hypothetical protein [Tanacetum cinerariifolium]
IIMADLFIREHAIDLPEVEPVQPELAPLAHEYVLPDEDEEPQEEEEEPQKEEEFDDGMEMDIDDEMDDPKVIHPYDIPDGAFPPPPAESDIPFDSESLTDIATVCNAPLRKEDVTS